MNSRELVLNLFRESLNSVLPATLIKNSITLEGENLSVEGKVYCLNDYTSVHVLGSGKASLSMAGAVENIDWVRGSSPDLSFRFFLQPGREHIFFRKLTSRTDREKHRSCRQAYTYLERLTEDDLFIYVLSGGSSAMIEKPVQPVTLSDFQTMTRLLLSESVPIEEMNAVRKHLSMVKGGRLAFRTKAKGIVLAVSDVIGDDLEAIGSAPLFFDKSSFSHAHKHFNKIFFVRQTAGFSENGN